MHFAAYVHGEKLDWFRKDLFSHTRVRQMTEKHRWNTFCLDNAFIVYEPMTGIDKSPCVMVSCGDCVPHLKSTAPPLSKKYTYL